MQASIVFTNTQRWLALCLIAAALASSGCGGQATAQPVDSHTARETLQQVLASWQRGEKPGQWQTRSPGVVVQDLDWQAGRKLAAYEVLGPGEARDANLYCKVRLTLAGGKRGDERTTVTYVVGTDPVLTVFRDMFQ